MRVILAGLGGIGRHHLRVLRQLGADVVAIVDPKPGYDAGGTPVVPDMATALAHYPADAAVLSTPVPTHYPMGKQVLSAGLHLFVEKPISPEVNQARELLVLAQSKGKVLAVGHSERFNPSLQVFQREFAAGITGELYRVESMRIGPYPQRPASAGVVLDLAVHDLEILESLLGDPAWVFARTEQMVRPDAEDGVEATLGYARGCYARLLVNWLSPRMERKVQAWGFRGMLECDLQRRTVRFYENRFQRTKPDEYGIGGIEVGEERSFDVPEQEPLLAQHRSFLERVTAGAGTDMSAVNLAIAAVRDAHAILASASTETKVVLP